MECGKLCAESHSSCSMVSTEEILRESNTIVDDPGSRVDGDERVHSASSLEQTGDACKLTGTVISVESSIVPIASDSQTPMQASTHNAALISGETTSIATLESTEENANVNITVPRDANTGDTKSIDSMFQYNWSIPPRLLCAATKEYQPTNLCENFTKGCQWSPDGTCLLVPSEDCRIRIYELPRQLYSNSVSFDFTQTDFTSALMIKEGGLIYDTCWYPFMNSWDPMTCCFLSTSKESPAHLWDAFTGELRATYRAYNQVDEVEASNSVQFVDSGKEVWCGFKNAVRIFDTHRPGRQIYTIQFKNDFPNMSGLVPCIRENPIMPGLVAFGSYSKCIGLYKDGPLCTLKTASGVTQIEFSSCGRKLFSAVRKNSEFLCWDLRNPGTVLYSFKGRQSDTNQRIQFAIMSESKQIISGGTDGNITMWELPESTDSCDEDLNPKYKIRLSKDCINGTGLHRCLPILATSSGQRQCSTQHKSRENSVKLWWIS